MACSFANYEPAREIRRTRAPGHKGKHFSREGELSMRDLRDYRCSTGRSRVNGIRNQFPD
jgi:hypothetical protein